MGGRHSKQSLYEEHNNVTEHDKPRSYDPSFRGPIKDRGCTDIICCFLFAIFFIVFLAIGIYAFASGDPRYLVYPVNSEGHLCGYGAYAKKPYLLYFDFIECFIDIKGGSVNLQSLVSFGCPTPQICVSQCPSSFWVPLPGNFQSAICKEGIDTSSIKTYEQMIDLIKNDNCAPYYLNSASVLYRCVPTLVGAAYNGAGSVLATNSSTPLSTAGGQNVSNVTVSNAVSQLTGLIDLQGYGMKILGDVTATWWLILIFVTFAMILSLIWIIIMRWVAGIMIYLTLLLFVGFFSFAIYYCFNKYVSLRNQQQTAFHFSTDFQYYINLYQTWLALGIIAAVLLGLIILVFLFLIKRIRIAIALIQESSRAMSHMFSVLLWPIVPYLLQMIALVYWGGSALCLAAAARGNFCNSTLTMTSYPNSTSPLQDSYTQIRCQVHNSLANLIPCNVSAEGASGQICNFVVNGGETYTIILQAFQLFVWLWLVNFIIALGEVTLAGSFASYYWAFHKPADIPTFPLASALGRALRYHIGSMAFGALLVAIIQFLRIILEYIDHKLKATHNCLAHFLLKCCICCLWCLEKFIKYINKNAYIMIAVYGKNFCTSAANAFQLILRNCVRAVVLDNVAGFLLFISKLFIVGAIGVLSYFFFAREIPGVSNVIGGLQLNYYLVPVIIIIGVTFVIASAFFGVYGMAVDTMFLCFLEDLERHDGTPEKPYYMSKELMRILGKKNLTLKTTVNRSQSNC